MSCSIISEKIQMMLRTSNVAFDMMIDDKNEEKLAYPSYSAQNMIEKYRSALQSPDLRRMELATMLRRAARRQQTAKQQKSYWNAFMVNYITQNANSNSNAA